MRPPRILFAVLLAVAPALLFADGSYQPLFDDGTHPTPHCQECALLEDRTNAVCNDADPDATHWADCVGGSICFYTPDVGNVCLPNCGRTRCLWV